MSRAMARAVSILPLIAQVRIQNNDSLRGIFGGRNGTGSGLYLSTSLSFAPVTIIPSVHHIHLFIFY